MNGNAYVAMIRDREETGSRAYRQQEAAIARILRKTQQRLGRPIDVLEFGCGFGRHASYVSAMPGVNYVGYDFSEAMTEPLRESPPKGMVPIAEHLLVGPDAAPLIGNRRFDVVFTVSVLIHNPPARIPAILEQLTEFVRPDGLVCLFENQVVPFAVFDNAWHDGCWLHAYADAVPRGWKLGVGRGFVDTHDLYVLQRDPNGDRRISQLSTPDELPNAGQLIERTDLDQLGMARMKGWATGASAALQGGTHGSEGRLQELHEQVRIERERLGRWQRLSALTEDLALIRNNLGARKVPAEENRGPPSPKISKGVLINDPLDTQWAHHDPRMEQVVHVFHQEWYGMRAAAGYLPGRKIAVAFGRPLTPAEHREVLDECGRGLVRAVVFHSHSANVRELMSLLRRQFGTGLRLYVVWHGSTAQFHEQVELEYFSALLRLRKERVIDGLGCVKPDMHLIAPDLVHSRPLLNVPPAIAPAELAPQTATGTVLIPVPKDWRKNLYTNLLAASSVEDVERVVLTNPFDLKPEIRIRPKVVRVGRPNRAELFRLIRASDVVLNATLSECQPMTALEALGHCVPCVTGPLSLGDLDRHPFQRLAQVAGVDTVGQVAEALQKLMDLRVQTPSELNGMMKDYSRRLIEAAVNGYGEFINA